MDETLKRTDDRDVVLVVDDEEDQRETLRLILEHNGYAVQTAENGEHALENMKAGSRPPCLVILDLMMPVMDGWKLWSEMSKDDALASIPVVVVSGVAQFPAAKRIPAVAHLPKPIELTKLYKILAQHC